MPQTLEERIGDIEHNIAELIMQGYATRLLSLSLFASHPSQQRVLDAYEYLRTHWNELALSEPISDSMINATDESAKVFQKHLLAMVKLDKR